MNINGKKFWIDVPDVSPPRTPQEILTDLKIQAGIVIDIATIKESKKKWMEYNSCYFDWLKKNNIIDFKAIKTYRGIIFKFINLDDAITFKLRWA